ncbi:ABC transporter permease [Burkholderia pseudomallei]|uniref:ABC transporter permease n=1 Tax=Burkholderia pseudomallei TaxID=28450 RepID=UPI000F07E574|nr:ABC transporter permease [Burkholderia pseudomallei]VCD32498.1 ABC transporter permease [Burkholderia pseudomallei]
MTRAIKAASAATEAGALGAAGRRAPVMLARVAALAALAVMLARPGWLEPLFVGAASAAGAVVALAAGIFVTRRAGAEFLPVARSVVHIGQTFPPVAVLALAVPAVGFGVKPVLIALILYGLLPIFESTIAGLQDVPAGAVDAARAMGMSALQRLAWIELPLAFPVVLNGIRLAVVINLGTATIGSTVAAKGLGDVIIAGLQTSNTAFVLQGGLVVALLAVLIYDALGVIGRWLAPASAAREEGGA